MTRGRPQRGAKRAATPGRVPRTARLNQLLREIIADDLERIGDDRLELVTITSVEVDSDLNRAIVTFDSLAGPEADERILEAFTQYRVKLQASVNRQMHVRKTPILVFRPDQVIRSAERIDEILRSLPPVRNYDDDSVAAPVPQATDSEPPASDDDGD
jgi:ribosome-binding factor A